MAYATRADLVDAYGLETVERLSIRPGDPDGAGSVARALAYADALIDAQLSVRFVLPLASVPPVLRTVAEDLAIARMATTADLGTDELRRREDRARVELREIATGKMNLGLPAIGAGAGEGAQAAGASPRPILGPAGSRLFSRDTLRSF